MNLMEELCRLYSCDEDKHKVLELRAARAQVDAVLRQREEHMAHILHGAWRYVALCPALCLCLWSSQRVDGTGGGHLGQR